MSDTTNAAPQRHDVMVLGKVIGTAIAWDHLDITEFLFVSVLLNYEGRPFVPDFTDGFDLIVNFETGEVFQCDPSIPDDEPKPTKLKANWAIFDNTASGS